MPRPGNTNAATEQSTKELSFVERLNVGYQYLLQNGLMDGVEIDAFDIPTIDEPYVEFDVDHAGVGDVSVNEENIKGFQKYDVLVSFVDALIYAHENVRNDEERGMLETLEEELRNENRMTPIHELLQRRAVEKFVANDGKTLNAKLKDLDACENVFSAITKQSVRREASENRSKDIKSTMSPTKVKDTPLYTMLLDIYDMSKRDNGYKTVINESRILRPYLTAFRDMLHEDQKAREAQRQNAQVEAQPEAEAVEKTEPKKDKPIKVEEKEDLDLAGLSKHAASTIAQAEQAERQVEREKRAVAELEDAAAEKAGIVNLRKLDVQNITGFRQYTIQGMKDNGKKLHECLDTFLSTFGTKSGDKFTTMVKSIANLQDMKNHRGIASNIREENLEALRQKVDDALKATEDYIAEKKEKSNKNRGVGQTRYEAALKAAKQLKAIQKGYERLSKENQIIEVDNHDVPSLKQEIEQARAERKEIEKKIKTSKAELEKKKIGLSGLKKDVGVQSPMGSKDDSMHESKKVNPMKKQFGL